MEVQRFVHEFGFEIFFLYRQIIHLKIKFWLKNRLVASYSQALIALKMWPLVTISTITFEQQGILRCGLNILESTHSELEFEKEFWFFSKKIKRVIVIWIWPTELPEIRIPIMFRQKGVKMEI